MNKIYLFSILKLGNDIVYCFITPLSLESRWQFRIISTACQACVCRAHSISTSATLPRAGDDNAFTEVIFAQHRMTPGSAVMGALLHLAQARGLGALQRECDVKQISYTMWLGFCWLMLMFMDVYGCLWMVMDVDVYDSSIFFGEAKLEMLTQDQ